MGVLYSGLYSLFSRTGKIGDQEIYPHTVCQGALQYTLRYGEEYE